MLDMSAGSERERETVWNRADDIKRGRLVMLLIFFIEVIRYFSSYLHIIDHLKIEFIHHVSILMDVNISNELPVLHRKKGETPFSHLQTLKIFKKKKKSYKE